MSTPTAMSGSEILIRGFGLSVISSSVALSCSFFAFVHSIRTKVLGVRLRMRISYLVDAGQEWFVRIVILR